MPVEGQTIKPLISLPSSNDDCWEWIGSVNLKTGYGKKQDKGASVLAHRWMYESILGSIPKDKVVDHLCQNRRCVNPLHLEAVSQAENCRRGNGTKLTLIKAKTVKRLKAYKVKGLRRKIAMKYNCSEQLVSDIWSGRAWKDI